jgi:hypothetical protein
MLSCIRGICCASGGSIRFPIAQLASVDCLLPLLLLQLQGVLLLQFLLVLQLLLCDTVPLLGVRQ